MPALDTAENYCKTHDLYNCWFGHDPDPAYLAICDRIREAVEKLNKLLNYNTTLDANFTRTCVTFGYIGNLSYGPFSDDRSWSVFLPHPNRVGNLKDRIGSFRTNDEAGARLTLVAINQFIRGVEFALNPPR